MTNRIIQTAGWLAASCLLVAITALPAQAQSRVRVTIPFAFEAGSDSLPAGLYVIERSGFGGSSQLRIHNLDKNEAFALLTLPAARPLVGNYPRLKFEILAGAYRLSEVWAPGSEVGVMVPRTRQQAFLAKNEGKVRTIALALTGTN